MKFRAVLALLLMVQSAGCAGGLLGGRGTGTPSRDAVTPHQRTQEWVAALINSQREAERGQHAEADLTLQNFATRHAGSAEAEQAAYWRAVYLLDPTNAAGSPRAAASLLDGYLASPRALTHRQEAVVMRRMADALDALQISSGQAAAATPGSPAPASPAARDAAREAELQKLRQELRETKEELERLRRRLAPPSTTPPPANPTD